MVESVLQIWVQVSYSIAFFTCGSRVFPAGLHLRHLKGDTSHTSHTGIAGGHGGHGALATANASGAGGAASSGADGLAAAAAHAEDVTAALLQLCTPQVHLQQQLFHTSAHLMQPSARCLQLRTHGCCNTDTLSC